MDCDIETVSSRQLNSHGLWNLVRTENMKSLCLSFPALLHTMQCLLVFRSSTASDGGIRLCLLLSLKAMDCHIRAHSEQDVPVS